METQDLVFPLFEAQLCIPYYDAPPAPGPGLLLLATGAVQGFPALLLVLDEGPRNKGVSATNAMVPLLNWAQKEWPELGLGNANVLQQDSEGAWDHVLPNWSEGQGLLARETRSVSWTPVAWPLAGNRTLAAVQGLIGAQLTVLLAHAFNHYGFSPINGFYSRKKAPYQD